MWLCSPNRGTISCGRSHFRCIFNLLNVLALPIAQAALYSPSLPSNLDLDPLGQIALTGDFDAVSLFSYTQDNNGSPGAFNGSLAQSLLVPVPDGSIIPILSADADILTMCSLTSDKESNVSVVVGGNFTSLGGVESSGIAIFNSDTKKISAVPGISGIVTSLFCDQDSGTVYVGGDFSGKNSTNAMIWTSKSGLSNLPFSGFNGPVSSIALSENGRILFGGSFDGLGNVTSPSQKDQQVINLKTAEISSGSSSTKSGFDDPRNVICPGDGQGGKNKTWLLADNSPGFWRATMKFGFQPTKLRIRNTHVDGRGTKTFRFTDVPDNGILNLTYTDPSTGDKVACDARCPLSDDSAESFRDFHFVNPVGMDGFQLDISEWYGEGGGLDGVELFQDDIFAYAVDDFNEPSCADVPFGSEATKTGSWTVMPSQESSSEYLSTKANPRDDSPKSITFSPDVKQAGNYSVTLYTPGCVQDGTCATRGVVNVTATFGSSAEPVQTLIFQTNNFDKYDQIYSGQVASSSGSFRPSIKIAARDNQDEIDMVASRVRLQLISSTDGLNGLFEFDPKEKEVDTSFTRSAINRAAAELDSGAIVDSLVWAGDTLFIGGNFTNSSIQNIVSFSDGNVSSLPDGGLNSEVKSTLFLDGMLYVGGNFSNTAKDKNDKLRGVGMYSPSEDKWLPMGAGVNGVVTSLVKFPVNISSDEIETTVAVSGDFTHINDVDDSSTIPAKGFAVWVPSKKKWLQELDINQMVYVGQLTSSVKIGNDTLLGGDLASGGIASHGAVSLKDNDGPSLQPLPVNIQIDQSELPSRKRFVETEDDQGVLTGLFDNDSGRNQTILAGHFTAKASNDSVVNNLLFLDGSNHDTLTGAGSGIEEESTFLSLNINKNLLYAGGVVSGKVENSDINGLVVYDLGKSKYSSKQPPALNGDNVVVRTIAARPKSNDIYVGGFFDTAGALPCPAVCNFLADDNQWSRPGGSLQGNTSVLMWVTNEKLIAGGNFTVGDNQTTLASFNTENQEWSSIDGKSSSSISGEVRALGLSREDGSQFWIAGKSTSGSAFLVLYDGTEFRSVGDLFGASTTIAGLQVLSLTKKHDKTEFLERDQVLLVTGKLQLPNFGIVSGALFNGTTLEPFILSSMTDGQPGSIAGIFTENGVKLAGSHKAKSRGIVVLISFCIALGCVFLIVLIGIVLNRIRRYRQGYVKAPQGTDRKPDLNRVPPEYLLESLRQRRPSAAANT